MTSIAEAISPSVELVPAPTGPLVVPAAPPAGGAPVEFSLILPTYNEAKNVESLLDQLTKVLSPELGDGFELIVVDDDSPDQTWSVALDVARRNPRVRVIRRRGEKGLSTAVIRGWQAARGEIIGVMDADLQHPPEVNLAMLKEIRRGAELAAGSRHIAGGGVSDWSIARRMLSRGAQLIGLLMLPAVLGRLSDPMSGYFMLRRSAIAGVQLDPLGYKILIEVVARGNIRWIAQCGYVFRERVEGESKVTWRQYVQYLLHLVKLRWATLPRSKLFRFCLVGASGVVVDMGILYVLSDPTMLGIGLTRSKFVAAECAMLTNFLLNDHFTFREASSLNPGFWWRVRRFLGFNAICSAGLVINIVLLNVLFNWAGWNRYLANAVAILIVTGWNYWLNLKLNWGQTDVERIPKTS